MTVVQRQLDSVQAALKERERRCVPPSTFCMYRGPLPYRQGATVEEMTIEVNKAKADLDNAESDLQQLATLNNVSIISPLLNVPINYRYSRG